MEASPKYNSSELKVFKLYFSKLVESISPWLANELYSNDLISRQLHKDLVGTTGSDSQKVCRLLLAVEDQIVVNPSVLHKFLSVMRGDPSLVHLADAMSDHYSKCSGECNCMYLILPSHEIIVLSNNLIVFAGISPSKT